jgi:hypothetical protein
MRAEFKYRIFELPPADFPAAALSLFRHQYRHNPLYQAYVKARGIDPDSVQDICRIPFLPIQFFKTHAVRTGEFMPELIFESSRTTGMIPSRHLVREPGLYRKSFMKGFAKFYGAPEDWCILGLLPSYLENPSSSLLYMVSELIARSGHKESGFYSRNYPAVGEALHRLEEKAQQTMLIGVSFALLEFAASHPMRLKHTFLMETGGMKGRGREMTTPERHALLKEGLGIGAVGAEYGMTEMMSQAYSPGGGGYQPVPWLRVLARSEDDPWEVSAGGQGLLNIIDLANLDSCAFIATEDVGSVQPDGRFEVMGRREGSDLRGCSLLSFS